MSRSRIVYVLLPLITLLAYWPVRHHDFVNFDDPVYVTENPIVQAGLTWQGTKWAFTTCYMANWHPLTWLSHMLDCQVFGLNAGGHHLVSVSIHAINAVLLFLLLLRATRGFWQSAFVAAVFAWHPLRVESVAWVAERKDVLSAFFGLLALLAYVRYVEEFKARSSKSKAQSPKSKAFYGLALFAFALGLMSKPMLVTLPFVMLLLDFWPLTRFRRLELGGSVQAQGNQSSSPNSSTPKLPNSQTPRSTFLRLVLEKLPFFLLSAAACVVTFAAQQEGESVAPLNRDPLDSRLANAAVAYVKYLLKSVCPVDLAVIYPMPKQVPGIQVLASIVILVAISWSVWHVRRDKPYLLMGWLWFLGMLVPVIGLVQVGFQSMADRYTYLPLIGVTIGVAFGVAELAGKLRVKPPVVMVVCGVILAGCLVATARQLRFWTNSDALFSHALAVTRDNYVAYNGLGVDLLDRGQVDEAMSCFEKALEGQPDYAWARCNLGIALLRKGRLDEASAQFEKALTIQPRSAEAHNNLGTALVRKGQVEEGIVHFQKALETEPNYAKARYNLAYTLLEQGRLEDAIAGFRKALKIEHDFAEAQNGLAGALFQKGQVDDAIIHFQEALHDRPRYADAENGLGSALLRKGKADEAMVHFQKALEIQPDYVQAHNNLGDLFLQEGKVNEAIAHFQRALEIKPDYAKAHFNLGCALFQEKDSDGAITQFERTVELDPGYVEARISLTSLLLQKGRVDEVIVQLQKILEIKPDAVAALNNLAWIRAATPQARLRDGAEAVRLAERACQTTEYKVPTVIGTLAAAYAEAGRFDDAVATSEKARELALSLGQKEVADKNAEMMQLFKAGKPYHEPPR
jgi:tetratricopeptide (TPR) repeat protein